MRTRSSLKCMLLTGLILGGLLQAYADSTYTMIGTEAQSCRGRNMDGAWMTDDTWLCSGGMPLPPGEDEAWPGRKLVIRHDIMICNNYDIDFTGSNLDTIIFRNGSSLHFRANGALLLPTSTVIIMEENTTFYTTNNSQGTLLLIGVDSIWGQQIRCIPDVYGPRIITDTSEICIENLPLPVTLTSFNVYQEQDRAVLEWQTVSELNSDYFEIERSADNLLWETIGEVKAAGWSTEEINYTWMDTDPIRQQSYYRLKQVDRDGSVEYLPIRSFQYLSDGFTHISIENPVRHDLILELNADKEVLESGSLELNILNMSGQHIRGSRFILNDGVNRINIPLNGVSPGVYFISVIQGRRTVFTEKFVLATQ